MSTAGGFIGWLDTLAHRPCLRWLPRWVTRWLCDAMDRRLGMTREEIRRARHGNQPGYTNSLDQATFRCDHLSVGSEGGAVISVSCPICGPLRRVR